MGVAQLVEHRSPKPSVGGSSPSTYAKIEFSMKNDIDIYEAEYDLLTSNYNQPRKSSYKRLWTWPIRHPVLTIFLIFLAINLLT